MVASRGWKDFNKGATPAGIFVWPKLKVPDLRFETEFGTFSVDLDLRGSPAEDFQRLIDEQFEIEYAAETADKRADGTLKEVDGVFDELRKYAGMPYGEATEGKEKEVIPGVTRFKFKCKAGGRYGKTHPQAGEVWKKAGVPAFVAKGNLKVLAEVWGGTLGRVSFTIVPWYTPSLGFGVRLQLEAVKVIELVTKGERSAESLGFEDEEGYEPDSFPNEVTSEAAPHLETGSDEPQADLPEGVQF